MILDLFCPHPPILVSLSLGSPFYAYTLWLEFSDHFVAHLLTTLPPCLVAPCCARLRLPPRCFLFGSSTAAALPTAMNKKKLLTCNPTIFNLWILNFQVKWQSFQITNLKPFKSKVNLWTFFFCFQLGFLLSTGKNFQLGEKSKLPTQIFLLSTRRFGFQLREPNLRHELGIFLFVFFVSPWPD